MEPKEKWEQLKRDYKKEHQEIIEEPVEVEETEADRANTIAWETRQLEIMDWITNDVDWMTGEHHSSSRRLAWHEGK